jgi:hypothetical protein
MDNFIGGSISYNESEVVSLKQQLELKRQENTQLVSSMREIKMNWKESEGEWERKRRELVERLNAQES